MLPQVNVLYTADDSVGAGRVAEKITMGAILPEVFINRLFEIVGNKDHLCIGAL